MKASILDAKAEIESDIFHDSETSEKVLESPDGGCFSGTGVINIYDSNRNLIKSQDIQNDPKSITVAEAKEKQEAIKANGGEPLTPRIVTRSGTPPTYLYEIPVGVTYKSNYFSARGWRYGEVIFFPGGNEGPYLR